MAKTPKNRPIRLDQFKKQLDDAGLSDLQEIQLGPGEDNKVFIRLAFDVDTDKLQDFMNRVEAAGDDNDEVCKVLLDYHPELSAEEQWERFEASDFTTSYLVAAWAAASQELRETAGKIKPRRS